MNIRLDGEQPGTDQLPERRSEHTARCLYAPSTDTTRKSPGEHSIESVLYGTEDTQIGDDCAG